MEQDSGSNTADRVDLSNAPKIENIEFLSLLGSGGMSTVYKARQTLVDRIVAVKVLLKSRLTDEKSLQRFQNEAKLSSMLDHPNIARTLGFGISNDGAPFLIMEYVDGVELQEEFSKDAPLRFGRFKDVFLPLLSALDHAHSLGVIHRDIKPANIIVNPKNQTVKLVDFGFAKVFDDETAEKGKKATSSGVQMGSPAYMSPEQCQGKQIDNVSDLYSLSCVMYEALCTVPPFQGTSPLDLMQKHTTAKLPSTIQLARQMELPEELGKVILWGLSKKREKRPQSANQMADKLSQALDSITLERAPRKVLLPEHGKANLVSILVVAGVLSCLFALVSFLKKQEVKRTADSLEQMSNPRNISPMELRKVAENLEKTQKSIPEALRLREIEMDRRKHLRLTKEYCYAAFKCCEDYWSLLQNSNSEEVKTKLIQRAMTLIDKALPDAGSLKDKLHYQNLVPYKIRFLEMQSQQKEIALFTDEVLRDTKGFSAIDRYSTLLGLAEILQKYHMDKLADSCLRPIISSVAVSDETESCKLQARAIRAYSEFNSGNKSQARKELAELGKLLNQNSGIPSEYRVSLLDKLESFLPQIDKKLFENILLNELTKNSNCYERDLGAHIKVYCYMAYLQDSDKKAIEYWQEAINLCRALKPSSKAQKDEFRVYSNTIRPCLTNLLLRAKSANELEKYSHYQKLLSELTE